MSNAVRIDLSAPEIVIPGIAEDGSYFPIEKLRAHRDAVFHLAVSVFVFSGDKLLIQRRADSKYHCAGLWANTCCTHPHWGENLAQSAARRMKEELGFAVPLTERRTVEYSADVGQGLHEHELVTMYVGQADEALLVQNLNPDEVSETRWANATQLRAEMAENAAAFAPWFRIYLERFPALDF